MRKAAWVYCGLGAFVIMSIVCISEVSLGEINFGQDEEYTTEIDTYAISPDNLAIPEVAYIVGDLYGSRLRLVGGGECVVPYGTPLKVIGFRVVSSEYSEKKEYIVDLGGGRSGTIRSDDKSLSLSAPVITP